jgi:glycosyltransferase involved in cell wall biosynthesis
MGHGRVSVLCPSRLLVAASSPLRELYVERAIRSVRWQSIAKEVDCEVVVAVDPGRAVEARARLADVTIVEGDAPGQAASVNAAYRAATGDRIALLEDDDVWHWRKLELQLDVLRGARAAAFVSCNQIEVDYELEQWRVNDFATPSGWLMERATWETVGFFDESFRWHVDNEWLGRLNTSRLRRVHLVERAADGREVFANLTRRSSVRATAEGFPLVLRERHPGAGTARIGSHPPFARESRDEYHRLLARFGEVPW